MQDTLLRVDGKNGLLLETYQIGVIFHLQTDICLLKAHLDQTVAISLANTVESMNEVGLELLNVCNVEVESISIK